MTGTGAPGGAARRRIGTDSAPGALEALVGGRSTVVCCGSGGVGKTTVAAALALRGAALGRRTVVVTIDPAKRLADALGLAGGLADTPRRIDGPWPGELWAVMLDTKTTFDRIVTQYAPSPEQAERILENRFYRNISGALSGTQEYMAAEKLYELHTAGGFDLVVVDTPPSRNALDFLDAPRRLTRFLDHRLYRLLMMPTRAYLKAVNVVAQGFLRTVSRVVGSDVVTDAIAFFQAFEGMEAGFRDRAALVADLLASPETAYVLVASPRRDAVEEAAFFADRLHDRSLAVAAVVVNRMHPRFGTLPASEARRRAGDHAGTPLGPLYDNLADFASLHEREEEQVAPLVARTGEAAVLRVPLLSADVHDLAGLEALGDHLFAQ